MWKRVVLILVFCASLTCLAGCSSEQIYKELNSNEETIQDVLDRNEAELNGKTVRERVNYYTMEALGTAKWVCPIIGLASILIGWAIAQSVQKDKKTRKFAICFFIISVPLLCFLIVCVLAVVAHNTVG